MLFNLALTYVCLYCNNTNKLLYLAYPYKLLISQGADEITDIQLSEEQTVPIGAVQLGA